MCAPLTVIALCFMCDSPLPQINGFIEQLQKTLTAKTAEINELQVGRVRAVVVRPT